MTEARAALGWGVALLVLGVVLLLRNAGIVGPDIQVWPWPLLGAGLALLVDSAARSGAPFGVPIVLTVVGSVFSLRELGLLPADMPLLPVVVIALGAVIVATGLTRSRSVADAEAASLPLAGASSVRMVLAYGAGNLRVAKGASPGLVYEGTFRGGVEPEARREGDRLAVTLRHPSDVGRLVRSWTLLDWDVTLTPEVPLDLEVRTGASRVQLDLEGVLLRTLVVKTGAADVRVILPSHGRYRVEIEAGAAEVALRLPEGVAGSIVTRSGLASVDIDRVRFPRLNGSHRSPDYDSAEHHADIEIEGGLASFSVR